MISGSTRVAMVPRDRSGICGQHTGAPVAGASNAIVSGRWSIELVLPVMIRSREAHAARLRAMMDNHFETVWRSLRRLGVPEAGADDAAQQVFVVASRRLDEITVGGERGYLLGIALRVASDARRTIARRREVSIDAELSGSSSVAA